MKKEDFLKLSNNEILVKYIKTIFLIDFYVNTWIRWNSLFENAIESIDIFEGIIDRKEDNDKIIYWLEFYKKYYEESRENILTKINCLQKNISIADNSIIMLYSEITRRGLNCEIVRYKNVIESRMKYYYEYTEGECL